MMNIPLVHRASVLGSAMTGLLVALLLAMPTHAAEDLTRADLEVWLDGFMPHALLAADLGGAMVAVVKDGDVLLEKGYGFADMENEVPLDPYRHVVQVASISKTFTWTAVMQLVEQGKLGLHSDINEYLDYGIPEKYGKPITLWHLMTHTPGFEEQLKNYDGMFESTPTLGEYMRTIPVPDRIDPPGTVQAYSNYGTNVAGYIVERVSGEPFAQYIDRHIVQPLGMTHASFLHPTPDRLLQSMAKIYRTASSREPVELWNPGTVAEPAGSFKATPDDMTRFMRAYLQDGCFEGSCIVKPETVQQISMTAYKPVPGHPGIGLGFFRADINGHRIIAHGGDLSGAHSQMALLIDEGVGFFVTFTSDGPGALISSAYRVREAILRRFMDRYFPAPPRADEPTTATAREHAQMIAGEYEMSRRPSGDFMQLLYLAARVVIRADDDGTLTTPGWLSLTTGRPQRWREVAPFRWREIGGPDYLRARVEDGRVMSVLALSQYSFELRPPPLITSRTLHLPLLVFAMAALLLSVIGWPVGAIMRRYYGVQPDFDQPMARARSLTRWSVVAALVFMLGWLIIAAGGGFSGTSELFIRVNQLIGIGVVAGTGVAIWHAYLCLTRPAGWPSRVWSIVLSLALIDLVFFALAFSLFSLGLNY